jgi:Rod binding domain-containing protein
MNIASLQPLIKAAGLPIENLAENKNLSQSEKIAEVCRQFEDILLRQILQQARKTVIDSEFTSESAPSGIYQDMVTTRLAEGISQSETFGLAKALQAQLTREISRPPEPATDPSQNATASAREPSPQ